MSDLSTKRLIAQYQEDAGTPTFFSTFFQTTAADIHNSDSVEIDVRRKGRPIAVAVSDWRSGGHLNTLDLYTNKRFVPPILKEVFVLNHGNLMTREMGRTPFEDPDFMGHAQRTLRSGVADMTAMIRRTVELQCSQILRTGRVDLRDEHGNLVYTIDYGMRSEHRPTASVDWDNSASDKIADLEAMDDIARVNGKKGLDTYVFGDAAWGAFLRDSKIQTLLDNRRIVLGGIAPQRLSEDQIFMGTFIVNGVAASLYTYKASYDDPQTGQDTRYIRPWEVIGIASNAPRRLTYGGIPRIVPVDARLGYLGLGSMLAPGMGIAATTNAWVDPEGTTIYGSVATRPLAIPVAIDCHVTLLAKAGEE